MLYSLTSLIGIPLTSALIGWVTNVIAVRMLFRPRQPIDLKLLKLQGLVPRRKEELAAAVAQVVEEEFVSGGELVQLFLQLDVAEDARLLLETRLDVYAAAIKAKIPMAAMLVTPRLESEIKAEVSEELMKMLPELKERISKHLVNEYDIRSLVEKKICALDLDRVEKIALHVAGKELRSIEILGGILGLFIGIMQLLFLSYC